MVRLTRGLACVHTGKTKNDPDPNNQYYKVQVCLACFATWMNIIQSHPANQKRLEVYLNLRGSKKWVHAFLNGAII